MKTLAVIAVLAALMTGAAVQAKETPSNKQVVKALAGVPAAELPATIVMLVQGTPKASQAGMVDAAVRQVAKSNPAALTAVVTALAKANASWAAVAAASAAKANPESKNAVATAAASAVPQEAARIVAAVALVTSSSRVTVAEAVAQSNPAFTATVLAREASQIRVETMGGSADGATGGTVFFPTPSGGNIGYTIGGEEVIGDPAPAPGKDGADPERYAVSGS